MYGFYSSRLSITCKNTFFSIVLIGAPIWNLTGLMFLTRNGNQQQKLIFISIWISYTKNSYLFQESPKSFCQDQSFLIVDLYTDLLEMRLCALVLVHGKCPSAILKVLKKHSPARRATKICSFKVAVLSVSSFSQIPLLIRHCAERKNLPIPRLTCLLVTISSSWSLFSFLMAMPVKIICILIIMTRLHKSILDQSVYHDKCSKRTLLVD